MRFSNWSNSEERSSLYASSPKYIPNKNRLLTHNINLLGLPLLPLTSPNNSYLKIDVGNATKDGSLVLRLLLIDTTTNGLHARLTSFA